MKKEDRGAGAALAAAALVLAVTVFVSAAWIALRPKGTRVTGLEPVADPAGPESPAYGAQEEPGGSVVGDHSLELAAELAPFAPDRTRPAGRYQLPDERRPPTAVEPPSPPPPAPGFRVLGTVVALDGGVAVIQVDDQPPRVLSLGEEISGYSVSAIQRRNIVLSGPAGDVSFAVADAPMRRTAASEDSGREQAGQGGPFGGRAGGRGLTGATIQIQNGRAVMIGPDGTVTDVQFPGAAIGPFRGRGAGGGGRGGRGGGGAAGRPPGRGGAQ